MPTHRLIASGKTEAMGGTSGSSQWIRFIEDPGDGGVTSTFHGGEPAVAPRILLDLSTASSQLLGQQVAMSATYRLRGMTIGFSPKEESSPLGVNNESDGAFNGRCLWFADTDHGRKALSLARKVERADEGNEMDGDGLFLANDKDYSAHRFNLRDDNEVVYPTVSGSILDAQGRDQWSLFAVREAYNTMTEPCQNNALFTGRFPGRMSFGWQTSHTSGDQAGLMESVEFGNGGWMTPHWHQQQLMHSCLAGLIEVYVLGSTMAGGEGTIQDDWHTEITVDWEVTV